MSNTTYRKKSIINECSIYILLWMLYYCQGVLYEEGSVLSKSILVLVLFFSVINAFKVNMRGQLNDYLKTLNVMLVMFTIYGFFSILYHKEIQAGFTTVQNTLYLKSIYISLLPVYSFYHFTVRGIIDLRTIKKWVIIFFIFAIIRYCFDLYDTILQLGTEEVTNNSGYAILSLIPLIVFWHDKPTFQYILLGVAVVLLLFSMKRGAILIGVLCVLWFSYKSLRYSKGKTKVWVYILTALVVIIGIYYVRNMLENSAYFTSRLIETKEGKLSGRDEIYKTLWNSFLHKTTLLQFFFGKGADATIGIVGNYAHNDWLEILINNGLLGGIIYLVYWKSFYIEWRRSENNYEIYILLGLTLLVYFMSTLFSMSYSSMTFYATCGLGYALGTQHLNCTLAQKEG